MRERNTKYYLELKKFCDNMEEETAVLFVKKTVLELLKEVINLSPVKTGRFKANWITTVGGSTEEGNPELMDKSSADTNIAYTRGAAAMEAYKKLDEVHISNNIKYADQLEYGSSKQAPVGVLGVSIDKIEKSLNESFKK